MLIFITNTRLVSNNPARILELDNDLVFQKYPKTHHKLQCQKNKFIKSTRNARLSKIYQKKHLSMINENI